MATNIIINYYNGSSYVELKPYAFLADTATSASLCTGNSVTATRLATSRTIRTNLASTSSSSFNGTANITPGVTGTLPVANGGTGVTSYSALATQLSSHMDTTKMYTGHYTGTGSTTEVIVNCGFYATFVVVITGKNNYKPAVSFWSLGDIKMFTIWYNSGQMAGFFGNELIPYATYIGIATIGADSSGLNYQNQFYRVICFA